MLWRAAVTMGDVGLPNYCPECETGPAPSSDLVLWEQRPILGTLWMVPSVYDRTC